MKRWRRPARMRADGLRPSPWLDAFGPGYIDMAFHAARAADPKVRLVYNDWGCEQGAAENDRFRAAHLRLLDGLLKRRRADRRAGHAGSSVGLRQPRWTSASCAPSCSEIRARGLAVLVTELDVDDTGGPSDIAARDRAVADEARRFLDVVLDAPATKAVLTWSLSDRYVDPPDEWKLKLMGWRFARRPMTRRCARKPLMGCDGAELRRTPHRLLGDARAVLRLARLDQMRRQARRGIFRAHHEAHQRAEVLAARMPMA